MRHAQYYDDGHFIGIWYNENLKEATWHYGNKPLPNPNPEPDPDPTPDPNPEPTGREDEIPGDVDANGVVDGRDVIRLMKYLAKEIDPETGEIYIIHDNNSDVDGNGVIDERDLLRLAKYLAGEDVTLEYGAVSGDG